MNVAEIVEDAHFKARNMVVGVDHPGGTVAKIAGVPIKMTGTPGEVHTRSPLLGEHTSDELLSAGIDERAIRSMLERGIARSETMLDTGQGSDDRV
jgi:crotonobetainyl-CoA:carnitine CoA-transferase CaiB-like acyl-CoA transferase